MTTTGRIVWYELLTNDVAAAIAFYTEVIGWTTQRFGDDYTMFVASQGPLGGVSILPEAAKAMGAQPFWQGNVAVANVDDRVEAVKRLGGTVFVVEDVPTVGRLAVIGDPQGASFTLFQPARDMPVRDDQRAGEFSWHELYTTDHAAAFAFYRELVGWQNMGEDDAYWMFGLAGEAMGGMMTKPPELPRPAWLFYITMPDLDAALERAKSRGARVIAGPLEVPGGQRIVQLVDPQGAAFALVTPASPE